MRHGARPRLGRAQPLSHQEGTAHIRRTGLATLGRSPPCGIEPLGNRPPAQALLRQGGGPGEQGRGIAAWIQAGHRPQAPRLGAVAADPMPLRIDMFTLPLPRHHHALDQVPNNRLAVCGGRCLSVPPGRQITREAAKSLAFASRQRDRVRGEQPSIVCFEPLLAREGLCPLPLQGPGHQTVFGVHRVILPRGARDLIARPLQALRPVLMQALALGFDIGRSLEAPLQGRRFERFQDERAHPRIEWGPGEGLAYGPAILHPLPGTAVAQSSAVVVRGRRHAQPTPAAHHQPRQQGGPRTDHAETGLRLGLELTPVALKLLPAHIGWDAIGTQALTRLRLGHRTPRGGTPRLCAFGIGRSPSIRIGASVDGRMQQIAQRRALGPAPHQLALAWAAAHPLWHPDRRLHQRTEYRVDRPHTGTLVNDARNDCLGLFIRLLHPLARGPAPRAPGHRHAQGPPRGLGPFAGHHALCEHRQFGVAHRPFEAPQQPVVVIGWVRNAIQVSDEGAKQGTHCEQGMPSALGTRQARHLQAYNNADMRHAHLRHQTLEAGAACHTGGRLASILIHHQHLRLGPAQSQRALD